MGDGDPFLMALPDWTAIFTLRPDLEPPGYAETVLDMIDNPRERPARGKSMSKGKAAHWTAIKHQSPDP